VEHCMYNNQIAQCAEINRPWIESYRMAASM
jgi:hypothetical protein